jgi:hypothetical protein
VNPGTDAQDISITPQRLGFEVVSGTDLDDQGKNYLAPFNAQLKSEGDIHFVPP